MAFQDYFGTPIAYDPTTGVLVKDAVFTVHAVDDVALATPLATTDPTSGVAVELRSSSVGVLPDFRVPGDLPQVILKSGSFTTKLTSVFGAVVAAGLDPGTVALAVAAGTTAPAAAADAVAARDGAVAAKVAAEAVGATNDTIMAGVAADANSAFANLLSANFVKGLNVTAFGAGASKTAAQNKTAFEAAFTAAAGATVHVPAGSYNLDNVSITGKARLRLDNGAVLKHTAAAGSFGMFNMVTGTELIIRGGKLDGNWQSQPNVTYLVIADLPAGKRVVFEKVEVVNSANATIRATNFGGLLSVQNCIFTGQKEHDGSSTGQTEIVQVVSGQENAKGELVFNHNRCIGTTTPALDGSNPGGVFIATNGYDLTGGGGSGSLGFANGNKSTFEAIGNYFYGYGQHCGPHDISPLHCYPTIAGARFLGNYFEQCGFSAISAKSVIDFVCDGNVILNGLTSSKNSAQEGAILYGPGYQANTIQRPRAVISNNVVTDPGGEVVTGQTCIVVTGTPDSYATDVVVIGNVLTGRGVGIHLARCEDATVTGNIIRVNGDGDPNTTHGIRVVNSRGDIRLHGNDIEARDDGIFALQGVNTARFWVETNKVKTLGSSRVGLNLRGMAFTKVAGNTIDVASGNSITVMGDGTTNVGKLVFDRTNTIIAGTVNLVHTQIDAFEGRELLSGTPTIAAGPAAGTSPTLAITGDGDKGTITITTGTSPALGGLATITLATPRRAVPVVMLTPVNSAAGDMRNRTVVVAYTSSTTSTFVLSVGITALLASTAYAWTYEVL